MGYQVWHDYGYGIRVSDIYKHSVERLRILLRYAPNLNASMNNYLEACGITEPTWDDYMDYDADCGCGLATILAELLLEVEDVSFLSCSDYDGELYLIYTPSYPWATRESERNLTIEHINQMLLKYIAILTDEKISIDYMSVENGG